MNRSITSFVVNYNGSMGKQPCITYIISYASNASEQYPDLIMIWNATKVNIHDLVHRNIAGPVYDYLKYFEKDLSVLESIYDRL